MKRIVATPQGGGSGVELDCHDSTIEWSMSAVEMSKPSRRKSPYSLNFRLPFTHANNQFFEHWYEVNRADNTWSQEVKTSVVVYDDLDELFQGTLQLLSVNVFANYYECVIIGEVGVFFTEIRGMTWSGLFTDNEDTATILDHLVTIENVVDSWDTANDITGSAGAGTIVYCIADNAEYEDENGNKYMAALGHPYAITGAQFDTPITAQFCRPTVRVVWLWDYIFERAGFTYESQFLQTDAIERLYMTLGTEKEKLPMRAFYRARVGLGANITPMTSGTYEGLPFTNESGEYADPDGVVTSGNFVAPADGTFQIIVQLRWITDTPPTTPNIQTQVRAIVNTTGAIVTASAIAGVSISSAAVMVAQYVFNLELSQGDNVDFQGRHNTNSTSPWYVTAQDSYIEMGTYVTNDGYLDVLEAFPDMTVDKWVKGIVAEFNLSMVSHPIKRNHLIVEPMQDYFTNYGEVRDWTRKVDLDEEIVLRPTTEEQKKRIEFTDKEGKDFSNAWWQNNFGWVKGRKRWDNDNDFAIDEEVVGEVFAPFNVSQLPYGWTYQTMNPQTYLKFLILRLWTKDRGEVKPSTTPPMLAFYHGLKDVEPIEFLSILYGDQMYTRTSYPLFTHLSDAPAQDTSLNLRWGYDYPQLASHPYVGISGRFKFREFYAAYLISQYGADSRVLECSMWLTPSDVATLSFADRIWVKDSYYRVYELQNYAVGERLAARVKLWKVLDTTAYECTSYPIGWQANGQVTFADAQTGSVVPATAICCLAADYYWDDQNQVCLWNYNPPHPTDGGQAPNSGVNNTGNESTPQVPTGLTQQESADPITGVIGTGSTWGVFGTSSGAGNAVLQTAQGQDTFYVPNDAVVMLEVQATTYQYGGTGGTLGASSSVQQQFLLSTTGGLYRVLSNSVVNAEGTTRSLNLTLTGNAIGELQIEAVGSNNVDLYWFGQVSVIGMVLPQVYTPPVETHDDDALWNGSNATDYIAFNGNDAHLIWNG